MVRDRTWVSTILSCMNINKSPEYSSIQLIHANLVDDPFINCPSERIALDWIAASKYQSSLTGSSMTYHVCYLALTLISSHGLRSSYTCFRSWTKRFSKTPLQVSSCICCTIPAKTSTCTSLKSWTTDLNWLWSSILLKYFHTNAWEHFLEAWNQGQLR